MQFLSRKQYIMTVGLALVASMLIVGAAAFLGRATLNLRAALTTTDKPDIAVLLLMGEKDVEHSTLLRDQKTSRDYLIEMKDGPKLVTLKKGSTTWYIAEQESLLAD